MRLVRGGLSFSFRVAPELFCAPGCFTRSLSLQKQVSELTRQLDAEREETRRLRAELESARDGYVSVPAAREQIDRLHVAHRTALDDKDAGHIAATRTLVEECERLNRALVERDQSLTAATKSYADDLANKDTAVKEAEQGLSDLMGRVCNVAVGVFGKSS